MSNPLILPDGVVVLAPEVRRTVRVGQFARIAWDDAQPCWLLVTELGELAFLEMVGIDANGDSYDFEDDQIVALGAHIEFPPDSTAQ